MKYNKDKIEECAEWVRINGLMDYGGATIMDFCKAMDIDKKTYYNWMEESTFSTAIKDAKDDFKASQEERLVESLMNSALGYEAEEVKSEYSNDLLTGKPKIKKQTRTKKHILPNTGAAIFLLTNIAPDKWKNKLNTEHSGEVGSGLKIIVDSEEDKELINEALNKNK